MALLTLLTLAWAAVLVMALAAGLVMIWLRLRRIDRALERVGASLRQACSASAPLEEELRPVEAALWDAFESVDEAAEAIVGARDALQRRSERAPAGAAGG